jgi:ribosome modulation factor
MVQITKAAINDKAVKKAKNARVLEYKRTARKGDSGLEEQSRDVSESATKQKYAILMTAIYFRSAQKKDHSWIEAKKDDLIKRAAEAGYFNTSVYIDNGVNGRKMDECPEFRKLLGDIEAKKVRTVLIESFKDLGRDIFKSKKWLNETAQKGVAVKIMDGFITINEPSILDIISEKAITAMKNAKINRML